MVVIVFPATAEIGVTQARIGDPLLWTVHAPHKDMPQPNLVPVKPSVSRRTQSRGMAAGTSTDCGLPLSVNLTAGIKPSRVLFRVYQWARCLTVRRLPRPDTM